MTSRCLEKTETKTKDPKDLQDQGAGRREPREPQRLGDERHQAGSPDLSPPGAEPKRAALGRREPREREPQRHGDERHQAGSPDLSPPGAEPKRAALGRREPREREPQRHGDERHQAGSPDLSPPGAEPKRAALGGFVQQTLKSFGRRLAMSALAAGCMYMTAVEVAFQLGPEPEWFA